MKNQNQNQSQGGNTGNSRKGSGMNQGKSGQGGRGSGSGMNQGNREQGGKGSGSGIPVTGNTEERAEIPAENNDCLVKLSMPALCRHFYFIDDWVIRRPSLLYLASSKHVCYVSAPAGFSQHSL